MDFLIVVFGQHSIAYVPYVVIYGAARSGKKLLICCIVFYDLLDSSIVLDSNRLQFSIRQEASYLNKMPT